MSRVNLEVCVDTIEGAVIAEKYGADRIELCAALSEGGLTPSTGLMAAASELSVPVYAMIRPRSGNFSYSEAEKSLMLRDIQIAEDMGLDGIVIGAVSPGRRLDLDFLSAALGRTRLPATLHRAFDTLTDVSAGVEDAVGLGFERILTSGRALRAELGVDILAETVGCAKGRLSVMAGAGITPENASMILCRSRVDELHASCSVQHPPSPSDGVETRLGFVPTSGLMSTSAKSVQALRAAVENSFTTSD